MRDTELEILAQKKPYQSPELRCYGRVSSLTMTGTGNGVEGNPFEPPGPNKSPKSHGGSDRLFKENIVEIGTHPLGIGLYLFDYKPEYQALYGYGRQFGVMADEVIPIMPRAVSMTSEGHKLVDYGVLGVERFD